MRILRGCLLGGLVICFGFLLAACFYRPTLDVPARLDAGELTVHELTSREFVIRNWAPWPVQILGGNFG